MSDALTDEITAYLAARQAVDIAFEALARFGCPECRSTLGDTLDVLSAAGALADRARRRGWPFLAESIRRDAA